MFLFNNIPIDYNTTNEATQLLNKADLGKWKGRVIAIQTGSELRVVKMTNIGQFLRLIAKFFGQDEKFVKWATNLKQGTIIPLEDIKNFTASKTPPISATIVTDVAKNTLGKSEETPKTKPQQGEQEIPKATPAVKNDAISLSEKGWKIKLKSETGEISEIALSKTQEESLWKLPYFSSLKNYTEGASNLVDLTERSEITVENFSLFLKSFESEDIKDFNSAIQLLGVANALNMQHPLAESWIIKEILSWKTYQIMISRDEVETALELAEADLRSLNVSDAVINSLANYLARIYLQEEPNSPTLPKFLESLKSLRPTYLALGTGLFSPLAENLDEKFLNLFKMESVEALTLNFHFIPNKSLEHLNELKNLKSLALHSFDTESLPKAVSHISQLKNLKHLRLKDQMGLRGEVLHSISQLKDLEEIDIADAFFIYRKIFEELSCIKNLKRLNINNCTIDGGPLSLEEFKQLGKFEHLESLNLSNNKWLTDEGLKELGHLKKLKELNISASENISQEELNGLKKSFEDEGRKITVIH